MEFIDIKTGWTILHLIGVTLGAGGAYASDWMFLTSVKDSRIDKVENRFLKYGSRMVWLGLLLLFISGLGLLFTNFDLYINSSKFLAKMTIVLAITINGLLFHYLHMPFFGKHLGKRLFQNKQTKDRLPILIASGVVSITSWAIALILGSLRTVPYSYTTIILSYLIIIILGIIFGLSIKGFLFPGSKK